MRCSCSRGRTSLTTVSWASGWKYCFLSRPRPVADTAAMNCSLPHSRVNMSTTILLSPYFTVRSTIASVFVIITGAKLAIKAETAAQWQPFFLCAARRADAAAGRGAGCSCAPQGGKSMLSPHICTKKRCKIKLLGKKILSVGTKAVPLHPQNQHQGPFVYRLGREIFIL